MTDETSSNTPGDEPKVQSGFGNILDTTPEQSKINRYVLVGLIIFASIVFIPLIAIFFVPVTLAASFATLFFPLYKNILISCRGKRGIASFITCLILVVGLLLPIYVLVNYIVHQSIVLYSIAEPMVRDFLAKGQQSDLFQKINGTFLGRFFNLNDMDIQQALKQIAQRSATVGTMIINKTSAGIFGIVTNLFITLFTMFYFFMDGERLVNRIKFLIPLRNEYEDLIFSRFLLISRATVRGTFLIGLTQGTLGALTLLIFGVKSWLIWGFIMVILSIVPMAGAWLVLLPAGIIQIVVGNIWQGIGIILSSVLLISNIDNVIRPRLVGQGAKMHDLLIFFSTLGGLSVFGVMGFIIGPVIAAFFLSVIDIYAIEFQPQLEAFKAHKRRDDET